MIKRKSQQSLTKQHLAYKQELTTKLHNLAVERDWCSAFDEVMHRIGLPGRDSFYGKKCGDPECDTCPNRARPEPPVGEDTAEAFEAWKRKTARALHQAARRYKLGNTDELAQQLGLPARNELFRTVSAVVEGRFTIPLGEVEVPIGRVGSNPTSRTMQQPTLAALFIYVDGTERIFTVFLTNGGDYPPLVGSADGREWVLAQRPGIIENVMELRTDGSTEPAPSLAQYQESAGVDATCIDCETRTRYRKSEDADNALEPCRGDGHDTYLLYVHLSDANIIEGLNRTVGDVREQCRLLP